jgi:hypothetical protein
MIGGDPRRGRRPGQSGAKWWLVLMLGAPIVGLGIVLQPLLGEFNASAAAATFVLVWLVGYVIARLMRKGGDR